MIDYLILVGICSIISVYIDFRVVEYGTVKVAIKKDIISKFIYFASLIAIILFSSLRTKYNDTTMYTHAYGMLDVSNIHFTMIFEPYGGFELFRELLFKYVSPDPQAFLFFTSLIANVLVINFIRKHSEYFAETMFLYLIGPYMFSMAGIKQAIAMAISLYAMEGLIERKYLKAIIILFLAVTFHPYIICLLVLPLIRKRFLDGKTILVLVIAFLVMVNLDTMMEFAGIIGKEYTEEGMLDSTINPIRVFVEFVPVLITFVFMNKIRAINDNEYVPLGINMQVIHFLCIFMGLFMNPVYFARMGNYFNSLFVIVMPIILHQCFDDNKSGGLIRFGFYSFEFIYLLFDITKIGKVSLFYDRFAHISIPDLLAVFGI